MTVEAVGRSREVWLRGNIRPGIVTVTVVAVVAAAAVAAVVLAGLSAWVISGTAMVAAIAVANALVAAWVVAQPRLARAGSMLEVRLAPGLVERVPLDVVECIFRGSDPILRAGEQAEAARFRVGTLVVRLAERATTWHRRFTFKPWGTWEDGHVVIDGRWCEPLSQDTVRTVAARLFEAKRDVAAEGDR